MKVLIGMRLRTQRGSFLKTTYEDSDTKECALCHKIRNHSEFYPRTKGFTSYCKQCLIITKRKWRQKPESREAEREYIRQYQKINSEKVNARALAYHHITKKGLKKPCETCGEKADMHHLDYSKPLNVKFLCRKHHAEAHK